MAEVLSGLSDALAAAVAAAGPSIVRVEGRERVPATGFVWAPGVVVTAHHVIEQDEVRVGLHDGSVVAAHLVGRDPTTDIAALRVETGQLTPAPLAEGDRLQVGQLVLAMGRPGRAVMASLGILSAVDGAWRTYAGGQVDSYVQPDVVMYPGFSGGPLVGADGRFLGLNTSALLRGVSITLPISTVRKSVEMLLAHGHIKRGYLGVGTQAVRLPEAVAREAGQESGLLLMSVEPGGPAEQGGLLLGDTVLTLDGDPVRHLDDLHAALSSDRVGKTVVVRILRGGRLSDLQVTVGERA